jgi:acyl-CoA thioester hydrolase
MNHSTPIRVYYEDTDSGGVVYYANYLKFAERGRTELLRSAGFENKSLQENKGIAFVVRHIEADYFKPAFLDNLLEVKTRVLEVKNASVVMEQTIFRNADLLFSLTVTLASVDLSKFAPVRLSDDLKNVFQKYLSES